MVDVDDKNIRYARDNVSRNNLQSRIRLVPTSQHDPLIPLKTKIPLESSVFPPSGTKRNRPIDVEVTLILLFLRLDFTMCNPPFYESLQELVEAAKAKQKPPFSVSNEFVSASKAARKGARKY